MTTKESIEAACLQESSRRFRQASDTPFLQSPLYEAVGDMGFGPASEAILAGTYEIPEGTDPYAAKLIHHLRMPDRVRDAPPVDTSLDVERYRDGWRKAKEVTSSGISGLYFSFWIAGVEHQGICEFEAIMANIPYRTGHSPPRWKKGINVMLLKKLNNYLVSKLRIILLYEADFNHNNKLVGRDMMRNAELHNTIAREQYGSRKNHSAIDHCLNKRLTFDIIRQKKIPLEGAGKWQAHDH